MNPRLKLAVAAVLLALSACRSVTAVGPVQPAKSEPASPPPTHVELYVMSQCPFGVQVLESFITVAGHLGPALDLSVDYIGEVGDDGELSSMHGANEVVGDIAQLCAHKYAPQRTLDFIGCQNKDFRKVAENWRNCAAEVGVPLPALETCLAGPEGRALLQASFEKAAFRNARGSPTIIIAGDAYPGRRGAVDLVRAICSRYDEGSRPASCATFPPAPAVNIALIADARCVDCNVERYVNMLKFRVSNPVITRYDYSSDKGQELYRSAGGGNLPLILFDDSIHTDREADSMFARHLNPAGPFRSLDIAAQWNPACVDAGGCAREDCRRTMVCRDERPKTLELFVMSQCPYGVRALNAMEEVLANFKGQVDFRVHYVASGTAADGFGSLHGPAEVAENIRELCAMQLYPKNYKWMKYVLCRNKDIRSEGWEACAVDGISAKAIRTCVAAKGNALHEADIAIANGLSIGASPTWVVNGRHKFSGLDAETVRRNLCEHNPGLKGCDAKLSGPADDKAPSGGCGK